MEPSSTSSRVWPVLVADLSDPAARDFLTGWMAGPDDREVWGRPVGLLQLADGSLLISDDAGKAVWHVSYDAKSAAKN